MIARGGRAFVFMSAVVACATYLVDYRIAIAFAGLAVFLTIMFRDPTRSIGSGVVAPADGVIREVDPKTGLVSTYLALRNVHVTRSPMDCEVLKVERTEGAHAPAFSRRSPVNERLELLLKTSIGQVRVVEMTGAIARRIVPYVRGGETLGKGDRLSLIRFGSRVDMFLPANARIVVAKGQKVRAGVTCIAEVSHEDLR